MSLMPTIHPPAINLLLKCQDVKFSSRMICQRELIMFLEHKA